MVEGRSFSSNTTKLLKHMDKLKIIQEGKPPSPVMVHISLINACNLTCSFCCFANRDMKDRLSVDKVKQALDSFRKIGVTGVEFTGGGEPTLHPQFEEIAKYAKSLGFSLGVCTNGALIGKNRRIKEDIVSLFTWVRLGMYGFYEGYDYDLSVYEGLDTTVSAAYVWDEGLTTSSNPNITGNWTDASKKKLATKFQTRQNFERMLDWVEDNKIPTRIAFNAIKNVKETEKDIETIRDVLTEYETDRGKKLEHAFLSDFNFKGERRNSNCYMHMVKPFLFTDGFVYVCPSAELSLENNYNYVPSSQFMVCDIDGIDAYYKQPAHKRTHACHYCKYAMQNELIDDVMTTTEHNDFA
jgi:pyruvate-formate lyase-activating enzyme|tara:strand:+ start:358 stop:1419 length:1062 start_codon:yes stop_codon:yes gene_type:complete